jgi:hypothetical protein
VQQRIKLGDQILHLDRIPHPDRRQRPAGQ